MKLLAVFGTRPEAIKMAPVINAILQVAKFEIKICVTAQHRKMLDQVLKLYQLIPDYDLNIMKSKQTLTHITQKTICGLEKIFSQFKPDWILVQGDTNTTFAASLAAFYHQISVAHIEAGLRTYQLYSPWPEEINRQLTSRIAKLHFAPTQQAKENLLNEGIEDKTILISGNTVIDALLETVNFIKSNSELTKKICKNFLFLDARKKLILVTSHRRENFGLGLQEVCHALLTLANRDDVQIVYPVHLNPNIQNPVNELLGNHPNIFLLKPLDYLPFVYLMMKSYLILTDSGGIQEEAPTLGKPVLVAREKTERPEGIAAGTAKLVGTNSDNIIQSIVELLTQSAVYDRMSNACNPYGDGRASQRIVERLENEC